MSLGPQLVESEHVVDFTEDGDPVHSVRITLGRGELAALQQVAAAAWQGGALVSADVIRNAKVFDEWARVVDMRLTQRIGETV